MRRCGSLALHPTTADRLDRDGCGPPLLAGRPWFDRVLVVRLERCRECTAFDDDTPSFLPDRVDSVDLEQDTAVVFEGPVHADQDLIGDHRVVHRANLRAAVVEDDPSKSLCSEQGDALVSFDFDLLCCIHVSLRSLSTISDRAPRRRLVPGSNVTDGLPGTATLTPIVTGCTVPHRTLLPPGPCRPSVRYEVVKGGSECLDHPLVRRYRWSTNFGLLVDAIDEYTIFMLDADGTVVTWNSGAQRIKGFAADEVIGRHFSLFYVPDDIAADKPRAELAIAAEQGHYREEGWRVRKNGELFWANVVITAMLDDGGRLQGFAKVTRDETERRLAAARDLQIELLTTSEQVSIDMCSTVVRRIFEAGLALNGALNVVHDADVAVRLRAVIEMLDNTVVEIRRVLAGP